MRGIGQFVLDRHFPSPSRFSNSDVGASKLSAIYDHWASWVRPRHLTRCCPLLKFCQYRRYHRHPWPVSASASCDLCHLLSLSLLILYLSPGSSSVSTTRQTPPTTTVAVTSIPRNGRCVPPIARLLHRGRVLHAPPTPQACRPSRKDQMRRIRTLRCGR
jgi:hypothetical protein